MQKESLRSEAAEVAGGNFRELLAQAFDGDRIPPSGERQVRMELAIFDGNAQSGEGVLRGLSERAQFRARFDAGPEHARVAVVRKPTQAANGYFDRTGKRNGGQHPV